MQRTVRNRIIVLALVLFTAFAVYARVGGGESYSGGGSSGSGGGGGDGGGEIAYLVFRFLLWLTIEHPVIGIPTDIVVIIVVVKYFGRKNKVEIFTVAASPVQPASARMSALRTFDPNFSEITFSDFCYSLYARAHEARGRGDLDRYAPYLSETARRTLAERNPNGLTEVRGVVIGSFSVGGLRGLDSATVTVPISFESNYTEVAGGDQASWYVREQWTLERARDVASPPPAKSKADHCPRCGAALRTRTDGACEYCGVKIENGSFQWFVRSIDSVTRESRGPLLTSNVPEQGTERATVFDPATAQQAAQFAAQNPQFLQRVRSVAEELQSAWTARDWERVRPLESESLFQMHRYWIDAYRRQKLRNVVDGFSVTRVQPVKMDADAFYESITVRLFAEGRDHTIDEAGRVVAGSKTQSRRWSEYWTFIRSRAAKLDGSQKIACPNCGAQVIAGASGICDYCGGKLTTGTFDWVLSRIEQDESYAG